MTDTGDLVLYHSKTRVSMSFPKLISVFSWFWCKIPVFLQGSQSQQSFQSVIQCANVFNGPVIGMIDVACPKIAHLYANATCLLTPNISTCIFLYAANHWK